MKNFRIHLLLLSLLSLGALTVNAAQLATAKVLSVTGSVNSHAEGGTYTPLTTGTILKQGDSVSTSFLSNALLVFSNGSEIVVEENTSITLAELSQQAFGGNKSYEQLQADPSKSQSLLELNYGKVSGHVKSLKSGSEFKIETPIGTAAIRGTRFTAALRYNAERGEFSFIVNNIDGLVDVTTRHNGSLEFARGNTVRIGYDSSVAVGTSLPLPPQHVIFIILSRNNPIFPTLFGPQNYSPDNASPRPSTTIPDSDPTAADQIPTPVVPPASPNEPVDPSFTDLQ